MIRPNVYTLAQWRADAKVGLLMAVGIGAISALPFTLLALLNLWRWASDRPLEMPWSDYSAVVAVVWASYLLAGQLGAAAYFLLRPTHRWILGWIATGAALAMSIYGTVGFMLAAFHQPVGRIFLEDTTPAEAWVLARLGTALFGVLGALFGAYHAWRVRTGRAAADEDMPILDPTAT